jgi:hypothetical protein
MYNRIALDTDYFTGATEIDAFHRCLSYQAIRLLQRGLGTANPTYDPESWTIPNVTHDRLDPRRPLPRGLPD